MNATNHILKAKHMKKIIPSCKYVHFGNTCRTPSTLSSFRAPSLSPNVCSCLSGSASSLSCWLPAGRQQEKSRMPRMIACHQQLVLVPDCDFSTLASSVRVQYNSNIEWVSSKVGRFLSHDSGSLAAAAATTGESHAIRAGLGPGINNKGNGRGLYSGLALFDAILCFQI